MGETERAYACAALKMLRAPLFSSSIFISLSMFLHTNCPPFTGKMHHNLHLTPYKYPEMKNQILSHLNRHPCRQDQDEVKDGLKIDIHLAFIQNFRHCTKLERVHHSHITGVRSKALTASL